jgi:hypothetical protein
MGHKRTLPEKRETASELAASLWRQDPISGGDVTKTANEPEADLSHYRPRRLHVCTTAVWEG